MEDCQASSEQVSKKPTIEQFLEEFNEKVKQVNLTYKASKEQFQKDMRAFKDSDILLEEEMIDKSISDVNFQPQMPQLNLVKSPSQTSKVLLDNDELEVKGNQGDALNLVKSKT